MKMRNRFLIGLCGFILIGLSLHLLSVFGLIFLYGGVKLVEPNRLLVIFEGLMMVFCISLGIQVIREAQNKEVKVNG